MNPSDERPIRGASGYFVNAEGHVLSYRSGSSRDGSRLRLRTTPLRGYPAVTIRYDDGSKRNVCVHVLVAEAFLGPRPAGLQVRHRDDDKQNARASNLVYGTQLENMADAIRNGKAVRGERHGMSKLSDQERAAVAVSAGSLTEVARFFGVTKQRVWQLRRDAKERR